MVSKVNDMLLSKELEKTNKEIKNLGKNVDDLSSTIDDLQDAMVQLAESVENTAQALDGAGSSNVYSIVESILVELTAGVIASAVTKGVEKVDFKVAAKKLLEGLATAGKNIKGFVAPSGQVATGVANALTAETMITVGAMAPIAGLAVGGTAFAWKYTHDKDFQAGVNNNIANSPLRYVGDNLDYSKRLQELYPYKNPKEDKMISPYTGDTLRYRVSLLLDEPIEKFKDKLKEDWNNLKDRTIDFAAKISTGVGILRDNYRLAWFELGNRVLTFTSRIETGAATIRDNFKSSWAALGSRGLGFWVSISTKASDLWNSFKSSWNNLVRTLSVKIKLPHLNVSYNSKGVGSSIWKTFGYPGTPNFSVSYYANGGFPSVGELFVARENGIPEMIGRMGSRTAVANNDQIVSGITYAVGPAVYNAMMSAMAAGNSNGRNVELVMNIDGREIGRVATDYSKLKSKRYNVEPRFV